jgi:hypothetical protein
MAASAMGDLKVRRLMVPTLAATRPAVLPARARRVSAPFVAPAGEQPLSRKDFPAPGKAAGRNLVVALSNLSCALVQD